MAESAQLRNLAIPRVAVSDTSRHTAVVRFTHWITALSFFVLLLSGIAILLAHPRLYWGETGAVGGPSLIDLPLPFVLHVPIRGPGRYLHFLAGWICVLTGLFYVLYGFISGHFRRNLVLTKTAEDNAFAYNLVQRLSYLGVIFVLFPLMIWTGLAMSPAVTSVFPWLVETFGGQQSARTIHFFVTCLIVVFVVVHIVMASRAGWGRIKAMVTGRLPPGRELS